MVRIKRNQRHSLAPEMLRIEDFLDMERLVGLRPRRRRWIRLPSILMVQPSYGGGPKDVKNAEREVQLDPFWRWASGRKEGGFLPGCGPTCWWAWSKQAPCRSSLGPAERLYPGFWLVPPLYHIARASESNRGRRRVHRRGGPGNESPFPRALELLNFGFTKKVKSCETVA